MVPPMAMTVTSTRAAAMPDTRNLTAIINSSGINKKP